jgi:hypothetical protein
MWISSPGRSRSSRTVGSNTRRPSLPIPWRLRIALIVEHGMSSRSASSGAVNRNRRQQLHRALIGAVVNPVGSTRTIEQTEVPIGPEAAGRLRAGPIAHSGRLRGLRDRPALREHRSDHPPPAVQTERSVSVQLHPVSSLGLAASRTTSLQGGPDEQRAQELQLDDPLGVSVPSLQGGSEGRGCGTARPRADGAATAAAPSASRRGALGVLEGARLRRRFRAPFRQDYIAAADRRRPPS